MDLYKALGAAPEAKAQWSNHSAGENREVSEWVEASPDRETRKSRIREACAQLAAGKRHL
ncbi:MAG: YdeI/OmpD-associated family protein [Fimbriimonadaceae bacterium]|nr:YdeI/OmpD-associated family protein [Chthonomonadaceae bacterium]MCO5297529.1 YdeI/OmpD-associated family protein [Fimbriimonadaceae bacterium]